jgi:hypothetical protein
MARTHTSTSLKDPLVLYSTCTKLAYLIAEQYYLGLHYVWCAPAPVPDRFRLSNPASSDPLSIYWRFHRDIVTNDMHSASVRDNKQGILKGAVARHSEGLITNEEKIEIETIVQHSAISDFMPLLFIIPFAIVHSITTRAPVPDRARSSSQEYIIPRLQRNQFDVLELHNGRSY